MIIYSSRELQEVIDQEDTLDRGPIMLASGNYSVVPPKRQISIEIRGINPDPYSSRVYIHNTPFRLGHYAEFGRMTTIPVGNDANNEEMFCFELDHSSRARIERVIFESVEHEERVKMYPRKETWDNIPQFGGGIRTTSENFGDDAWHIELYSNIFRSLRFGIKTSPARKNPVDGHVKGTIAWDLKGQDFDGCRYAIYGDRIGEWKIYGGIMQLADIAYYCDGSGNVMRDTKFERNRNDVVYGPNSCANALDLVNAAPWKMTETARNKNNSNRYRRLPTSAIWRPCERHKLPKPQLLALYQEDDLYEDDDGNVYSKSEEGEE